MFLGISQNSQENTFARASFLIKLQATLAQVFSCEFCEISKNNFFDRPHAVAAPSIKPYFQRGPLTEILTITILRPQTG